MTLHEINATVEKVNIKHLKLEFVLDEARIICYEDGTLMDFTATQRCHGDKFFKPACEFAARPATCRSTGSMRPFLSAFTRMATRPLLADRLFMSPMQINPSSFYRLWICKKDEW